LIQNVEHDAIVDMIKVQTKIEKLAALDPNMGGNVCTSAVGECQSRAEQVKLDNLRAKVAEKEQRAAEKEAEKLQRDREREELKRQKEEERACEKERKELEREALRQQKLFEAAEALRLKEIEDAKLAPKIGGIFAKVAKKEPSSPAQDQGKLFGRECWTTLTHKDHVSVASVHRRGAAPLTRPTATAAGEGTCVKFLLFHQNNRPAYFGSFTRPSNVVCGRDPLAHDEALFEYEVDSDEEWEEPGDGEELGASDNEEEPVDAESEDEDDGFCVADGYLSDEECDGTGAAKRKLSEGQATNKSKKRSKLQHRVTVVGPIWDLNKAKVDGDIADLRHLADCTVEVLAPVASGQATSAYRALFGATMPQFSIQNKAPKVIKDAKAEFACVAAPAVKARITPTVIASSASVFQPALVHHTPAVKPAAASPAVKPAAAMPAVKPVAAMPAVKPAAASPAVKPAAATPAVKPAAATPAVRPAAATPAVKPAAATPAVKSAAATPAVKSAAASPAAATPAVKPAAAAAMHQPAVKAKVNVLQPKPSNSPNVKRQKTTASPVVVNATSKDLTASASKSAQTKGTSPSTMKKSGNQKADLPSPAAAILKSPSTGAGAQKKSNPAPVKRGSIMSFFSKAPAKAK